MPNNLIKLNSIERRDTNFDITFTISIPQNEMLTIFCIALGFAIMSFIYEMS